jgi:HK97 family phage portal protein
MIKEYIKKMLSNKRIKEVKHNIYDYHSLNYSNEDIFATKDQGANNSYTRNVIVYKCVNLIANAASHVPWIMHNSVISEKILKLLKRPNPGQGGAEFFSNIISSKLLFGNSYILAVASSDDPVKELYILDHDKVSLINNANVITGYKYNNGSNKEKIYRIDFSSKQSQILHLKNYNPTNNIIGLSCLTPAKNSIDLHDKASRWNNSLLENGARPSGALVVKDGNYLNDEQFERLKEQLHEKYTGSKASGRPMLLEGGLSWQEMSISPKDMDFIESKNCAAREIALAFGVPPQLLGIAGDNTYSNMQEARLALWEETIIPLLDYISDAMSNWLSYWYEQEIILDFDLDAISALTQRRENLWSKVATANFMTLNEKRKQVGLKSMQDGDKLWS